MEIIVTVKSVYGNETIYPANEAAEVLAHIAGTRSLRRRDLELAQRLGHTIKQVAATNPLFPLTTKRSYP